MIDLAAYFDRIGYRGSVEPTLTVLSEVHWRHQVAIPFEALDINPLGRTISLELSEIEAKIVGRRRGGFCYEMNGLLAAVLDQIGFTTQRVSVQFLRDEGLSPPFDHMAIIVGVPGDSMHYLADVGNGDESPARPLALLHDHPATQAETGRSYRLIDLGERWRFEYTQEDGSWGGNYVLDPTPRQLADFATMCRYQDSDPASFFAQFPICTQPVPNGRNTIFRGKLILTRDGARDEQPVETPEALRAALREHFGITLNDE